jgi:hypothetical protein
LSQLRFYIHKIRTTPLHIVIIRVFRRFIRLLGYKSYQFHDRFFDTRKEYKDAKRLLIPLPIKIDALNLSKIDHTRAENLVDMWIAHRFDLLGSGWIQVGFENNAPGLNEYRYDAISLNTDQNGEFLKKVMAKTNFPSSKEIYKQVKGYYRAIDWQKDFKSGYRWGADKWFLPQGNAKKPGGDIKVPWELARLQHFPRMAIFAYVLPDRKQEIFNEFCNQSLDFIAQNPVRMGVNYMCTMDVGIRAANLALAYSLFKAQGFKLDYKFEYIFANFMFEQCNHIMRNLEWSEVLTSNHYFANIAGLLFGSSVLPECKQKYKWLKFSIEQIKNEISKQFLLDGTNGEGSTAYHRLTGEMAVYSAALIESLGMKGICRPLNEELISKLFGAGLFTKAVTRPDNMITQIGDNDSGVFFRLSPTGEIIQSGDAIKKYKNLCNYKPCTEDENYLDENLNDCRTFTSSVGGLFGAKDFEDEMDEYPLEASLISALAGGKVLKAAVKDIPIKLEETPRALSYTNTYEISSNGVDLVQNITLDTFAEFGLYIFKSDSLYLVVNGSDNGQKGNAGHAHNDKLSFELFINGKVIFQDPGVFVYTALPDERNSFRSVKAHNTIYAGREQNDYITLFAMKNNTRCKISKLSDLEICLFVEYCDIIHQRTFKIHKNGITIIDCCNVPFEVQFEQSHISAGYGKVLY